MLSNQTFTTSGSPIRAILWSHGVPRDLVPGRALRSPDQGLAPQPVAGARVIEPPDVAFEFVGNRLGCRLRRARDFGQADFATVDPGQGISQRHDLSPQVRDLLKGVIEPGARSPR